MDDARLIFIRGSTRWRELPEEISESLKNEMAERGFFHADAFRFAGLFYSTAENAVVVGFPKYWQAPATAQEKRKILEHMGLLCRVAAQAEATLPSIQRSRDWFEPTVARKTLNAPAPYELAVFLMQDYAENGLYTERARQIRMDGAGHRDWRRTIQRIPPVFEWEPLYLRSVRIQSRREVCDLITPLHAHAVNRCAKLLRPLGLFEYVHLPEETLPTPGRGELARYIPILNEKMNRTFSQRELKLLRALRAWCGLTPFLQDRFGVLAFELLWEYAVDRYFGNISGTRSGVPHYHRVTETGGYDRFEGSGDAIPDTLYAVAGADGKRYLAIFDAKYYCPKWDIASGRVKGAPANADIAKQVQYYHSLRQRYPAEGFFFSNAFLLPQSLEGELYRYIGYATESDAQSGEILAKLGIDDQVQGHQDLVLLFLVDPARLWQACLEDKHISEEEILKEFIARMDKEQKRLGHKGHP